MGENFLICIPFRGHDCRTDLAQTCSVSPAGSAEPDFRKDCPLPSSRFFHNLSGIEDSAVIESGENPAWEQEGGEEIITAEEK